MVKIVNRPIENGGAKETKKNMLKTKKDNINAITASMSGHSVIVDGVNQIVLECSGKMRTFWQMVDEGTASEAVETMLASVPDGSLSELFAFNTSKPDAKLEYTAKVLMKYYVPNVVNASAYLDTSHQSALVSHRGMFFRVPTAFSLCLAVTIPIVSSV